MAINQAKVCDLASLREAPRCSTGQRRDESKAGAKFIGHRLQLGNNLYIARLAVVVKCV